MKAITTILTLAMLAGCATVRNSPAQPYRAPDGKTATISGRLDVTDPVFTTGHNLTVTIDGTEVIKAPISEGNADIAGTWQGRKVLSLCSRARNIWTGAYTVRCRVLIDGDFAATLEL